MATDKRRTVTARRFYPDLPAHIQALHMNEAYLYDRASLDGAPLFFNDSLDEYARAERVRARMTQARIPSFSKWHIAESVQIVLAKHRNQENKVVLQPLERGRFVMLRINPHADKESVLREAWARLKWFKKRGSNRKPFFGAPAVEPDGSIVIKADITSTRRSFEKGLWAAIRLLRSTRTPRLRRGHSGSPLDDIAVLRSLATTTLHATAKQLCGKSFQAVEDEDVDRTLQGLKRARDRALRHSKEAYPPEK